MSTIPLTLTPPAEKPAPTFPSLACDEAIRRSVQRVLRVLQMPPENVRLERRHDRRYAFPYPVTLIPLDAQSGIQLPEERIVVLGKHLSERGFDFYHVAPVPFRRVIASFESQAHGQFELPRLVLALAWCRFGQHGWYENGGRFLQVLEQDLKVAPNGDHEEERSP